MTDTTLKQARALVRFTCNGHTYVPNELVEQDAKTIAQLEKDGKVDSAKEAVAIAQEMAPAKSSAEEI